MLLKNKTELTYAANEKDMLAPEGIKLDANAVITVLIHSAFMTVLLRP